jgi:hypothetical protein
MGTLDAQSVLDAEHVPGQVGERVRRLSRRVAGRAAGVPMVVPDHEPASVGDPFAQLGVPPQHRGGRSGDQHDRGVRAVAEGLDTQLGAVDAEESFAVSSR